MTGSEGGTEAEWRAGYSGATLNISNLVFYNCPSVLQAKTPGQQTGSGWEGRVLLYLWPWIPYLAFHPLPFPVNWGKNSFVST